MSETDSPGDRLAVALAAWQMVDEADRAGLMNYLKESDAPVGSVAALILLAETAAKIDVPHEPIADHRGF